MVKNETLFVVEPRMQDIFSMELEIRDERMREKKECLKEKADVTLMGR